MSGSTSTIVRRCKLGARGERGLQRLAHPPAVRALDAAAARGTRRAACRAAPARARARAAPRASAVCRSRCTTSAASSIAPANVRARTMVLIERDERRIAHRLPELQLALVERRVVLPAGELDAVVIGIERLDDRLARLLAAAGAAGHLRQQLKRPLGGAEVGHAEADVGRDDADQRHARKIVPLGDHLRADEHVDLAVAEPRQQRGERAFAPDRVAIEPRDARARARRARLRPRPARCRSRPARDTGRRRAGTRRHARRVVAVVAARAPRRCPRRGRPARRCSSGQSSVPAHCRQNTAVAKPRRLSSTSDCSPRASRASIAVAQRAAQDRRPGPRRRTPRACRRPSPRRAAGRARAARARSRSYLPVIALW